MASVAPQKRHFREGPRSYPPTRWPRKRLGISAALREERVVDWLSSLDTFSKVSAARPYVSEVQRSVDNLFDGNNGAGPSEGPQELSSVYSWPPVYSPRKRHGIPQIYPVSRFSPCLADPAHTSPTAGSGFLPSFLPSFVTTLATAAVLLPMDVVCGATTFAKQRLQQMLWMSPEDAEMNEIMERDGKGCRPKALHSFCSQHIFPSNSTEVVSPTSA